MPRGKLCQNSIGFPKMRVGTRAPLRCAATESPYGPAPMTTVGYSLMWLPAVVKSRLVFHYQATGPSLDGK